MKKYNPKFTNNDLFEKSLAYYVPKHGSPNQSLKVPESFSLYVCPASCARRLAVRSIKNGTINESAFLLINDADVISGDYEEKVADAVYKIITERKQDRKQIPRAFVIYVNCIDDFLGTDEYALIENLKLKFQDIAFTVCHINPISDGKGTPRGMIMYDRLYDFLFQKTKDSPSVNFIGNYVSPSDESEVYSVLSSLGINKVNEIFNMETFSQYEEMANSRLNIVLMVMGLLAAETMKQKFGIPYLFLPPSYDLEQIEKNYHQVAEALGKELSPSIYINQKEEAKMEIEKTLKLIGNMPIVVDTYSSRTPFALAKTLKSYGFNVKAVFASHAKETDKVDLDFILENYKDIYVIKSLDYNVIKGLNLGDELIAIGFDSAYTLKAKHFVDIKHDETLYGFYGVKKLMQLIREAFLDKINWDN